ncbi:hypothetical protein AB0M36_01820 [Actinoplanes sp. NPDC051346]|uniref:hypothetical protein n=1 Tax=Actinoplanes sp. NPDC051346 TaxID=3155048 RepID=UPI0034449347
MLIMASRRWWGKAAAERMSPEERQQVEHDTHLAIYRFQNDAYRNLRYSIAAAIIIFGLFVGSDAFLGNADGTRLWPCLVLLLSAALSAGHFAASGSRPRLALQLLLAAVFTTIIGVILLIAVSN